MDFSRQPLAGVVFRDADLYQASFGEAELDRAVFLNCFAAEAEFQRANCTHMRALGTSFYRADFAGANLCEALLWNCVLAGANLRGATVRRITLTLDCNSFEEIRLDQAASVELAYLFGRTQSAHRQQWLDVVGPRDLAWLGRVFAR